jgi:alpha-beta hydrolase superfamily lysophospholipase
VTALPSRYLHGPATAEETRQWLIANEPPDATVDPLDRKFLIVAGGTGHPLRLETLAVADRGLSGSTFHVITADCAGHARALALDIDRRACGRPDPQPDAVDFDPPDRRAEHVVSGTWDEVTDLVSSDGDAEPIVSFDTTWPPLP